MIHQQADCPHIISVRAPARLHLGFLDLNATIGRKFGSIGLSINSHQTHIRVQKAEKTQFIGNLNAEVEQKLQKILSIFFGSAGSQIPAHERNVSLEIIDRIPEHSGLGSGTQLALAVGTALCRLYKISCSTREIAQSLERGKRSGIGIATFDQGGFVVDAGIKPQQLVPPVIMQQPFPESWRIVMILSPKYQGIHGQSEKNAFKELPLFPIEKSQAICHLTLMQIMPALLEQDIDLFGDAITQIQTLVGDHFAPMQGGRYTSTAVAACLAYAQSLGHKGIAQSSWGPTGCIFVENDEKADKLISQLDKFVQDSPTNSEKLTLIKVKGDNIGAVIESNVEI